MKKSRLLFSGNRRSLWSWGFRAGLTAFNMALILAAVSCGSKGSSGTPPPPPPPSTGVTISPKTLSISRGGTAQFSATVTSTTDQSVYWEVNNTRGGDLVHGVISRGGVYVAPTSVPNPATVTVKAVSFSDATKLDSATVTITAGSAVSVVINEFISPITVPTFGTHAFSATVTGTANTAVIWEVNGVVGGSAATGVISSAGVYTAPHSVPVSTAANNNGQAADVIVTAVSQADSTASDSVIVLAVPPQQGAYPEPIPLGVSGGNGTDTSNSGGLTYCCSGTLGALVSRGGNLYVLSNNHILARSDQATLGDPILQPGLADNNCSMAGERTVASLSQFFNLETGVAPHVDAALAEIMQNAVEPMGTIVQLGGTANGGQPTDGTPNPGPGVAPSLGLNVSKSGSATGLTCSSIIAIDVSASVDYQKACVSTTTFTTTFTNQIDVGGTSFSANGDSGSLIVTQDTADPVGLLYAGSDADTIANPVSDVLAQLADPGTGELPLFAGDAGVGPHPVAACNLPLAVAAQKAKTEIPVLPEDVLRPATTARDAHLSDLLGRPEVAAVGVGASRDNAAEPAILLFVKKGRTRSDIPAQLDGVRTRIIVGNFAGEGASLSAAASASLESSAVPTQIVYRISAGEVVRAKGVVESQATTLMTQTGIQGVGITSSLDSPGEAAMMVFVVRGVAHNPIPAVIDGLRTRIRESSRFRAR